MDIFNKKKIERLESQIELLKRDLQKEKAVGEHLGKLLESNKQFATLLEQNQRLIDWIEKILSELSTVDVDSRRQVIIPIYKRKCVIPNPEQLTRIERTITVIPEIVIQKEEMV